ncbi:MAG: hypothetical protein GY926_18510 [bacterium]|nr:hypothetical protein [bacterium]
MAETIMNATTDGAMSATGSTMSQAATLGGRIESAPGISQQSGSAVERVEREAR